MRAASTFVVIVVVSHAVSASIVSHAQLLVVLRVAAVANAVLVAVAVGLIAEIPGRVTVIYVCALCTHTVIISTLIDALKAVAAAAVRAVNVPGAILVIA